MLIVLYVIKIICLLYIGAVTLLIPEPIKKRDYLFVWVTLIAELV